MESTNFPRLIHSVPPQLGGYVRVSRQDQKRFLDFLSQRTPAGLDGVIFDPRDSSHSDLLNEIRRQSLEAIIDVRAMELSLDGGFVGGTSRLPWAAAQPHSPNSLRDIGARQFIRSIVGWLAERNYSAVFAPSHFLRDAHDDPWFAVDRDLTFLLREELNAAGLSSTLIYYPLALRTEAFFDATKRGKIRAAMVGLPIDALWLRIHPFGSRSGAQAVRNYIRACADWHSANIPVVAERSGTIGLALLAFGAIGATESGITLGEHFDAGSLLKARKQERGFAAQARIYIPELQTFLSKKQARTFFENRTARAHFGCKDDQCCRRGPEDTLLNPQRHFLNRRMAEISRLSTLPEQIRPGRYLEEILRPATDRMASAVKLDQSLEISRYRLDSWRAMLGGLLEQDAPQSFATVPAGKRIETRLGA